MGSVGKRFAAEQGFHQDPDSLQSSKEMIDWKCLRYHELVGVRPTPDWLTRVGNPAKKTFSVMRDFIRKREPII